MSYVGSLSVGAFVPIAATAVAGAQAQAAQLNAQLTGQLELQAKLTSNPPSIAGQISALQDLIAALQVATGGTDFQLAAVGVAIAELGTKIAALEGILELSASLAAPGVHLYRASGKIDEAMGEIQTDVGGGVPGAPPEGHHEVWLVVAADGAAQAALKAVLRS